MLKFFKRWLGWDSDSGPFDFGELRIGSVRGPSRPQAPPRLSPPPRPDVPARTAAPAHPPQPPPPQAQTHPKTPAPKKPRNERAPIDVLDNPRLTLDRPSEDGFDPYNTGAFNRSASWERIGRNKKR